MIDQLQFFIEKLLLREGECFGVAYDSNELCSLCGQQEKCKEAYEN
jgi:hypothetical protein